jgi:glycosyltransferase involved in cell wall biosynthesis
LKPRAIHQFSVTSGLGDRATKTSLFIQRILRDAGYESEIYCVDVHPFLSGHVVPFQRLCDRADDLILVHHSLGEHDHRWMLGLEAAKVFIYQSATSADLSLESVALRRARLAEWGRMRFLGAIADSPSATRELRAAGFASVTMIPLAVDLDHIRHHPFNCDVINRVKDARYVICLNPIAPRQGQIGLIRMMSSLIRLSKSPVHLILAGNAALPAHAERLRGEIDRLQLADAVVILERPRDDDVFGLYRMADLFVSMSHRENFGTHLIEAMAIDVPILAYAAPAIASTFGGGGLLIDTRDPDVMAASAKLILEEPWLRRQIIHAQRGELAAYERNALAGRFEAYLAELDVDVSLAGSTPKVAPRGGYRIEGPFDSSYSLAVVNRELANALAELSERVTLVSRDGPGYFPPSATFLAANPKIAAMWQGGSREETVDVALRNLYPPAVADLKGELRGLACYAWEESGFPPEWVRAFNANLDLVGVISSYVAKVLRDNGVYAPIRLVGAGIDQILHLEDQGLPEGILAREHSLGDGFCFLHISSGLPRKGIDLLLAAWARAFTSADDVVLVIKTVPNQHHRMEDEVAAFAKTQPRHARIVVINQDLDARRVYELYCAADAIVCASRGEGFGLPLAEALGIGKPVIATAYGGQTDFCNSETAWLCDYQFAYARTHLSVPNSVWVEPKLDCLVDCLRAVRAASPLERARRANAGRALVRSRFRWEHAAARLRAAVADVRALDARALRLPKVGWVSPWGSHCGIAAYSQALAGAIAPERLIVFANRDATPIEPDAPFVRRCWERGPTDVLDDLGREINAASVDAVVIQFDFGLYRLDALARLIDQLCDRAVPVYVSLHSTLQTEKPDTIRLSDVRGSLMRATRLLVHAVHDLNRLKQLGLVDNVTLLPFGMPDPSRALGGGHVAIGNAGQRRYRRSARRDLFFIGKSKDTWSAKVATFGYLLPNKGLCELIDAFAMVRSHFAQARLFMLNAIYPGEESAGEHAAVIKAIRALRLERCVTLRTDYLSESDALACLADMDLIVYPYQISYKSASGAVRFGLSSLAPVACTPLAMFEDVAPVTHGLPGTAAGDLAAGISALLRAPSVRCSLAAQQLEWAKVHSWPVVAARFAQLIRGEFVERLMSTERR